MNDIKWPKSKEPKIKDKWRVEPEFDKERAIKDFVHLEDAKAYAIAIAKKRAFRSRGFNVMFSTVGIYLRPARGFLIHYASVAFPVRGTGTRGDQILSAMEKNGHPAFKVVKSKNYKRALARFMGKPYEHL